MNEHERRAQAIADGGEVPAPDADSGPIERNLERLHRIAEAFRATPSGATDGTPFLFHWRHLEVRAELGEGGFGTVYEAWDPILKRAVALKLGRLRSEARDRWIIAEARRMARVRHPNVLAIHGADNAGERTGIWCDLIRGETLQQVLEREGPLAPPVALRLARALADALAAIHDRGLVHGDIKPANVMIRRDGEPVLMDFGAASEQPLAGPIAGSPIVMAPELFSGGHAGPAVDVYAFGALLYRMLCGRYPIEGDSYEALAEAHRRGQAPDLGRLPRPFREPVRACLQPDPAQRPAAPELQSRLRRLAEAPARRRRRLAVATVIASLALALGATAVGLWQVSQAREQAEQQRAQLEAQLAFVEDMLGAPRLVRGGPEIRVVDVLEQAARQLDASAMPRWQEARLRFVLGRTFESLERYEDARAQLERAAQLAATPQLAQAVLVERIEVESGAERFERARELVDALEALLAREPALAGQGPLIAFHRGKLAFESGDKQRARELLEAVAADPVGLPPEHPANGIVWRYLAALHREAAEFGSALEHAAKALAWEERVHGPGSIGAIGARNELATAQYAVGRYAKSEATMRRNLELLDRIAPGPSAARLRLLNGLSIVLAVRGELDEAIARTRELIEVGTELHGPESSFVIKAIGNMGARHVDAGAYAEAERWTRRALELATAKWGAESADTLLFASNLAEMLLLQEKLDAALEQSRATLETNRRVLGPAHLYTLFVADIHGAALVRSGRVDAGMALLDRTLALKEQGMGADNPFTWDTQAYRVEGLLAAGRTQEARELAERLLAARRATLGEDDRKTVLARQLLAKADGATAD